MSRLSNFHHLSLEVKLHYFFFLPLDPTFSPFATTPWPRTTPTEKKNPAEQVCFYCKQGRTGHIDEAMAGSSSSL